MRSNQWELEEAYKALQANDTVLASRYLEKALECVRCMYCHGDLNSAPYHSYFKGYRHDDCEKNYSGRIDYMIRNGLV